MIEILIAYSQVVTYLNTPVEYLIHNGYSSDSVVQEYVDYAYQKGGLDFVKLIECENGRRDPYRKSDTGDHGICQLNYRYNKKFINSDDFHDVYKQIDYCYEKYQINPNLRHGPNRKIRGQKCTDYVSNRFSIESVTPLQVFNI